MKDINDNAPSFGQDHFNIDIPENIPSGTLRKLPPAKDPDQDGVQKYEIVQGNTEGVFDLKHDKETLDLVSYTSFYTSQLCEQPLKLQFVGVVILLLCPI